MKKPKKTTSAHEVRVNVAPQHFEVRKNPDGSPQSISGYAAMFNSLSEDLGGFYERIKPGAFAKSLKQGRNILCLYGHDSNSVLGSTAAKTLTLREDDTGLYFSCLLPDTSVARDLAVLISQGIVNQMSFGFSCPQGGDDWDEVNGKIIRTLTSIVIFECSAVSMPAYQATSVNLRSAPASVRRKLRKSLLDSVIEDDDSDEDEDYPDGSNGELEDRDASCGCDCDECTDSTCDQCSDISCTDENCDDCPMQTRCAHLALLTRRAR
jgi:HK97 family phage prohead protease